MSFEFSDVIMVCVFVVMEIEVLIEKSDIRFVLIYDVMEGDIFLVV